MRVRSLDQKDSLKKGNPLQYSCLEKPMDRGAWQVTAHGVTQESDTAEWLNNNKALSQGNTCLWARHSVSSAGLPSTLHILTGSLFAP